MGWRPGGGNRGGTDAADRERAYRESLAAAISGDWDTAEQALAGVVQADSDCGEAYLLLAALYRRQGEVSRAIRIHQNLLLRRDLPEEIRDRALCGLARDFRSGGFLQRALAATEEQLQRRPRDAEALEALMQLSADTRDFERALWARKRLSRVASPDVGGRSEIDLLIGMARYARQTGGGDDARRRLRRALKKNPGHGEGWALLGELEAERDKTAQALSAWQKAVAAEPRLAGDLYPRIEAGYAARGKSAEFEKSLRQRLQEQPADSAARVALAQTLAARGDTELALAEVGALLEAEPDRLEIHAIRAEILLRDGREAEAAKALGELRTSLDRLGLLPPRESLA